MKKNDYINYRNKTQNLVGDYFFLNSYKFSNADYEYVGCELFSSREVNDNWHQTPAISLVFLCEEGRGPSRRPRGPRPTSGLSSDISEP